jgi:Abortive infection alpha
MSDPRSIIPISDEQAKALQEALKTLQGIGGFLKETFGTVPEDLAGLLGGDWLKVRRAENFVHIVGKARERIRVRHVIPKRPRLSILVPLVAAAADEESDELQDIWARLLAAAADPVRTGLVRLAFVDTVKNMDPLDALVLQEVSQKQQQPSSFNPIEFLASKLGVTHDEIIVSYNNLERIPVWSTHSLHDGRSLCTRSW